MKSKAVYLRVNKNILNLEGIEVSIENQNFIICRYSNDFKLLVINDKLERYNTIECLDKKDKDKVYHLLDFANLGIFEVQGVNRLFLLNKQYERQKYKALQWFALNEPLIVDTLSFKDWDINYLGDVYINNEIYHTGITCFH